MVAKYIRKWAWPGICAIVLTTAYATPGSDEPVQSLSIMSLVAIFAGLAFLLPLAEAPKLRGRPECVRVMAAAAILAAYLAIQQLALFLIQRDGNVPGLYDPSRAILEYLKLAGVACAFALGFRISQTDDGARRVMDLIIFSGVAWAVVAIALHIKDPDRIYGVTKISGFGQLTGTFSSPNSAGTFFGTINVMALGRGIERFWKIRGRHVLERIDPLFLVMWIVSLTALTMTLSRTGIVATGLMSFLLIVVLFWRRMSLKWLLCTVGASCVVLIAIFVSPLGQLMGRASDIDFDKHIRARIFFAHFNIAIHQPWFGAGYGSFNAVNQSVMTELNYSDLSRVQSMHNVYLQWFEECGVIGLLALAILNISIVMPIFFSGRRRQNMGARLWIILFAYGVFLVHGFTDYAFQEPSLETFSAILLGCGLAMATNSARA